MSGFTLSAIRSALKNQLKLNIGGREVNVYAYRVARPVAPYIQLDLDETPEYFLTLGPSGISSVRFSMSIVPGGVDDNAVIRLDDMLSVGTGNNSSIVDALKVDPTLGGVANTLEINPGEYDAENVTAELLVTVHVNKQGAQA